MMATDWSPTTDKFTPWSEGSDKFSVWSDPADKFAMWSGVADKFTPFAESLGRYLLGGPSGVNHAFSESLRLGGANVPDDPIETDW